MTTTTLKSTAKDFFLHLFSIIALGWTVGNFLSLAFLYINRWYPDALDTPFEYDLGSLRFAVASLVIIFPLYLLVMRSIGKIIAEHVEKRDFWARKWMIYLTLFIAAITIAGDLVTLVYNLLGGETTIRFILKTIVVLITASAVGTYYFFESHEETTNQSKQIQRIISITAGLLILAAIITGFFFAGSPFTARQKKLDEQRVSDLQTIQWQIVEYWRNKKHLPETLALLPDPIRGVSVPLDPVSRTSYGYQVNSTTTFELCANFTLATSSSTLTTAIAPYSSPSAFRNGENDWGHGIGLTCFSRTIDPDFFKQ